MWSIISNSLKSIDMKTLINKKTSEPLLDYPKLREAVLTFRGVNHKLRQKMLDIMEANGRVSVTDIYIKCRIEQSMASQHLAILRRAGAVIAERDGKIMWYSVNTKRINQINKIAQELN